MKLLEEKINTDVSLKNILFATDFSAASEAALPYVAAMSLRYGGTVHVAHVLPEINLVRASAVDPVTLGSIYEDAHSRAQEKIQEVATRLAGYPHRTHVRHGKVSEVLSEIIHADEIDLLVTGTHGRTGLGKLFLGSVAEEILRTATCPVLTVGPKAPKPHGVPKHRDNGDIPPISVEVGHILYATDFGLHSLIAAPYAFSLAREFRARLVLLHVIEEYGEHLHNHPGPIAAALRKLEQLQPEDAVLRHSPEPVVQFGSPADHILQTATERETDLIVLGARPRNVKVVTHLPWTTAHKVITNARCPVLTVR